MGCEVVVDCSVLAVGRIGTVGKEIEAIASAAAFCAKAQQIEKAGGDDDDSEGFHSFGCFFSLGTVAGEDTDAEPADGSKKESAEEADGSFAFFI